ncbi:predicted protein [Thalassiosira pseudonana CCMP1335]|uniref:EF-hand domain-containing protein n=2 Tax=Thalassiosira pseudonana TaxID=35128 RepID=B8LD43_THAPS|nr:predicted protein [Thalassiosira pseudonana CCMP1335]EED86744.1 predicted protein [Thalassiosira pseudonana CCMP1335]
MSQLRSHPRRVHRRAEHAPRQRVVVWSSPLRCRCIGKASKQILNTSSSSRVLACSEVLLRSVILRYHNFSKRRLITTHFHQPIPILTTMIAQKKALLATLTIVALNNANAFVVPSTTTARPFISRPLYESSMVDQQESTTSYQQQHDDDDNDTNKLIMDIPPTPKATPTPKNPAHKEGIFSPLVYAASTVIGPEQLNKVRAQIISLHSDIIKSFVSTSDSTLGKAILRQLFEMTDADNSGYLDKREVEAALNLLGFKWLKEKHVEKIFERADLNSDGEISLEEFMAEAPKTLKVNLVKLAKNNGGDMGLLV